MRYCFKNSSVDIINSKYMKESYNFKLCKVVKDLTDDILYSSFYKIEYLYLVEKLGTDDFRIYDVDYLEDNSKVVYVRLMCSNLFKSIRIPPLDVYYEDFDVYRTLNCYYWQSKKGIRKVVSEYKLRNFNENRFYKVGDINKYGHKLISIKKENILVCVSKRKSMVGLKFN